MGNRDTWGCKEPGSTGSKELFVEFVSLGINNRMTAGHEQFIILILCGIYVLKDEEMIQGSNYLSPANPGVLLLCKEEKGSSGITSIRVIPGFHLSSSA